MSPRNGKRLLRAYGADVVWTDPMDGSDGAIAEARRLFASNPGAYFYADQYNNDANWRAHFETTGPEILEQTDGRVTHFVAGLGTTGTFMGTGRRLRAARPGVELISVEPDSPLHGLEGLKHMETALVPGIYDASLATRHADGRHRRRARNDARARSRCRAPRRPVERRRARRRDRTRPHPRTWPHRHVFPMAARAICLNRSGIRTHAPWQFPLKRVPPFARTRRLSTR
jgi:hypothetical protein